MPRESGEKVVCVNRKARHEYFIDETWEAGLVLLGPEVKSLRDGKANLKDGYVRISRRGEAFLVGAHISAYAQAARDSLDPERERKLLLNRGEIDRLGGKIRERGYTLVPLRLYFSKGKAKLEIGLGRGKKLHDKRQTLREAESRREVDRVMKSRRNA